MALMEVNFFSKALMRPVTMNVILPADKVFFGEETEEENKPFKTLYLLHGVMGNYTDWVTGTCIKRWAEEKNLAVVMPSGANMFYMDHPNANENYSEFIGKELVKITRRMFPLSHKKEDTFIAGLSMGGYGAIRNGLKYHDTFGYIAGLSSAVILEKMGTADDSSPMFFEKKSFLESVFGDLSRIKDCEINPEWIAENMKKDGIPFPHMYLACGLDGEAMDYLVNKFNEENTDGITVEAVYQGEYDDTINKLKSAQIGNMGADLVQIYDIGTRFMIDSGWVIPMQELINADGYDISQIEPNIAAYYTVNNELYSMPFNSSTPILYYNKDMFEKAGITEVPTSLEGILAIGDDLKTKGGAGEPLALSIYGWYFEQWLCKQGLSYADNGNGRDAAATAVEFDSNGGALNILNEWKALNDADVAPNVGRDGSDTATTDFTSGKAAITLGSTASLKQILQDVNGSFEVGTAYFPTIKDGDEGGVSIGGASLWALNNNDDMKAAATWKFIKFLISPESQAYWNAETGYFPVTRAADEEQTFKDNVAQYPQFQTAIDQLHDSKPQYAGALLSVFPEARQIVETEIENMINGNETPEKAVESMASQINSSIEDYNLVNE